MSATLRSVTEMPVSMDFLVRLRKIDLDHTTPRDVIMLWAIRGTPGMMGQELAKKIGLPTRSNVQDHILRMIRKGYIEDRRPRQDQRTPNDLYITPKGEAFLNDVVPS